MTRSNGGVIEEGEVDRRLTVLGQRSKSERKKKAIALDPTKDHPWDFIYIL